jgi:hypothetical protein
MNVVLTPAATVTKNFSSRVIRLGSISKEDSLMVIVDNSDPVSIL